MLPSCIPAGWLDTTGFVGPGLVCARAMPVPAGLGPFGNVTHDTLIRGNTELLFFPLVKWVLVWPKAAASFHTCQGQSQGAAPVLLAQANLPLTLVVRVSLGWLFKIEFQKGYCTLTGPENKDEQTPARGTNPGIRSKTGSEREALGLAHPKWQVSCRKTG